MHQMVTKLPQFAVVGRTDNQDTKVAEQDVALTLVVEQLQMIRITLMSRRIANWVTFEVLNLLDEGGGRAGCSQSAAVLGQIGWLAVQDRLSHPGYSPTDCIHLLDLITSHLLLSLQASLQAHLLAACLLTLSLLILSLSSTGSYLTIFFCRIEIQPELGSVEY
ncbi:hypothetical protein VTN02DRAFT_3393 [Thermoascus thermophilus]